MKKIILACILPCVTFLVTAQTIPVRHIKSLTAPSITSLMERDFSALFVQTENSSVYGFIGDNYQRLRIKFITVKKGKKPSTFNVYGKSMVKGTICEFNGTLKIVSIKKFPKIAMGVDSMYAKTGIQGEYQLNGEYVLEENRSATFRNIYG